MVLRFLGKDANSVGGDSPTLYATDHGTYIIQGWIVTDADLLAKVTLDAGQDVVEIPFNLFDHLAKDGLPGVVTSWIPPIVHVTDRQTCLIQGVTVTDQDTLARMAMPDHESCVEVPKASIAALQEEGDGAHHA
ncbi:hypothetical protein [Nonomuraea angiospora]|uniref:hypothetical protein n=1 Tax=Nonomuraea angiospora TaxID=46172 RepID=UPI0029AC75CD|nr:hypothetical protein [Nonomuraea angiospora]MDX3101776.1 hypothetical protein [Nonomuraea angiospora]